MGSSLVIPGDAKRRPGIQRLLEAVNSWIPARALGFALGLAGMTVIGLSLVSPAHAHPPARLSTQSEQAVAGEVEAFYKALAAAVAAKDVAKLKAMYAESFTHTHTSAKIDGRDARIVSLLAGEATVELLPFTTRSIAIHAGGWAAVARGVTPIKAADGKTYGVHWAQFLTRGDNDGWMLIASQATRGAELGP